MSGSLDEIGMRARRVLDGTQTGRYTRRAMARDILALVEVAEAAQEVWHETEHSDRLWEALAVFAFSSRPEGTP